MPLASFNDILNTPTWPLGGLRGASEQASRTRRMTLGPQGQAAPTVVALAAASAAADGQCLKPWRPCHRARAWDRVRAPRVGVERGMPRARGDGAKYRYSAAVL